MLPTRNKNNNNCITTNMNMTITQQIVKERSLQDVLSFLASNNNMQTMSLFSANKQKMPLQFLFVNFWYEQ